MATVASLRAVLYDIEHQQSTNVRAITSRLDDLFAILGQLRTRIEAIERDLRARAPYERVSQFVPDVRAAPRFNFGDGGLPALQNLSVAHLYPRRAVGDLSFAPPPQPSPGPAD